MANTYLTTLYPTNAHTESQGSPSGGVLDPFGPIVAGFVRGMGFNKLTTGAALFLFRVPSQAALATGLTFYFVVADDVNNASVSLNTFWGVTVGPLATGVALDETALSGSTETTGAITSNATAGKNTQSSIAVVNANMNSLAVNTWAMIRVRRLGTNASDTHRGRVILEQIAVYDT